MDETVDEDVEDEDELERNPFVNYLIGLKKRENRGALAALRRGSIRPDKQVTLMGAYIIRWLPSNPPSWVEDRYYLLAGLFARHPVNVDKGNMGNHLAKLANNMPTLDKRMIRLLGATWEEFPDHLGTAVTLLKANDIPVNWDQLMKDIGGWGHPAHYVQRQWANAYWGQ